MRVPAIAAILLMCAGLLAAQDLKTIEVASDEWADCTLKDGSGLYFDVMRMVFDASKLSIKIVPFARSVQMLETGKTDVCVGVYQGDVSKGIYPKYPLDFDDLTVMMLNAKTSGYAGEASLKDKKVAWIIDYAYDKYLNVPIKLTEVSDTASGIKMLQSGRVDYYIETKSTIGPALKTLGIAEKDFHLDTVKWVKLYLAFSKNEKGQALQALWDKRMPVLFKSGQLKKAFDKWGFQESYEKLKKEM
jgi:polar amino acid transport system substrate-binding protein